MWLVEVESSVRASPEDHSAAKPRLSVKAFCHHWVPRRERRMDKPYEAAFELGRLRPSSPEASTSVPLRKYGSCEAWSRRIESGAVRPRRSSPSPSKRGGDARPNWVLP